MFTEFQNMERMNYSGMGFAVGMAYAELVSQTNDETREILDRIKRKLKKSGLLPREKKGGGES
jgi:predicted phosphoribosyltransferase